MVSHPNLQVEYLALDELHRRPGGWWRDVLALVHFDEGAPATSRAHFGGVPTTQVTAAVLGGAPRGAEIWRLSGPMNSGQRGPLRFRRNGRLLFASMRVSEEQFAAAATDPAHALRTATELAYRELFNAVEELGFPHLLRIWNFVPDINGSVGSGERYWHFNSARQNAFLGARHSIAGNVPAASAVGIERGSALAIYCIAGLEPPIVLENPRQCSPWDYPPQYGPSSPTFARACLGDAPDARAPTLFISGTASIVGHETAHPGDPIAQTRETLRNIRALIGAANAQLGEPRFALERLSYKVYLRRAEDQPRVDQVLREESGVSRPVLYLKADMCRRDLVVEIEATGPAVINPAATHAAPMKCDGNE